ncbi:hypothetical protein GQ457_05G027460 [Hibiscus cannabinus]
MSPLDSSSPTANSSEVAPTGVATKMHKAFTNKKVNVVLDEYNFLVWKQQVLLAVRSLRLEKLLTGALKSLPVTVVTAEGVIAENEDYEVFVAQDSALDSWLLSTISAPLLPQFVGVWSTVLRFFASRSTTTIMSLHYKLRLLKKGDLSMRTYISQVKEIYNALASSGSPISDLEKIATILNGLSIEYQPFVSVITASREPFTLDAAISVLLDAETQLSSFNPLSEMSSMLNVVQASVVDLDSSKAGAAATTRPYRQSSASRGGRSSRMRVQCQLCGKLGHLVDRCWHRFDENFVPVTARTKDSLKSQVNIAHVSSIDMDSQGCSCKCAGVVVQNQTAEGQSSLDPQMNLVTAADHWFVDSGASHHVTPDPALARGGSDYLGPGGASDGSGVTINGNAGGSLSGLPPESVDEPSSSGSMTLPPVLAETTSCNSGAAPAHELHEHMNESEQCVDQVIAGSSQPVDRWLTGPGQHGGPVIAGSCMDHLSTNSQQSANPVESTNVHAKSSVSTHGSTGVVCTTTQSFSFSKDGLTIEPALGDGTSPGKPPERISSSSGVQGEIFDGCGLELEAGEFVSSDKNGCVMTDIVPTNAVLENNRPSGAREKPWWCCCFGNSGFIHDNWR